NTMVVTCPPKLFCWPSCVIWVEPVILGGGSVGRNRYATPRTPTNAPQARATTFPRFGFAEGDSGTANCDCEIELDRPESISRFSRLRSTASSVALWYRMRRSFSIALL